MEMKPTFQNNDNMFYFRMKEDLSNQQRKLKKIKNKEMEAENEKMYSKLLWILNRENNSLRKQRIGPVSLNIEHRRREITQINQMNNQLSRKLGLA